MSEEVTTMKRFIAAVVLTFVAALSGVGVVMADTDDGTGIVGVQAP